ncbi:hypothetical protein Pan44_25720 [Caulifigura coniformis]|uniref:Tetratricopeptide repeat-like domain-containing protein n=1 Tax=Caulifigura coniformis TaxID=2527983 RepID=A0A517SEJ4_9PLAN|nr:hypothetical protein [Caulifigura coniformis]QDT54539.1 hypothetical protein Pan44_25720 [Caulifigura coniformis]
MKSEERHQLAQNDLQVGINRWLDRIEPYSNHILGGAVVATIVAVALILWFRSSSATSEAGWSQIASARSVDALLQVAEENPGTAAANWARLQAARQAYSTGIETALTDRKSSDESLKQAKDLYDELLKARTTPELREEALKGMGLTLEATSGGDVAEAIKAYELLIKEFPQSTFRDYAAHRVEELKNPQAGEFYAWFRKQNPKPAERPLPNDGKPATDSSLSVPALPELDLKADTTAAPKADNAAPALPAVPPTDGKAPPAAPPATPPAPATESTPAATPMPMPEAPKATPPMPMPEAPAPTAPMPEPPATPAPEAAKPADPGLPALPTNPVEPPK